MRGKVLSNPLGDIRAEADHHMLGQAFYETPDYLSLLDSDEKVIVVGRRGTGKSALTYRLGKQWSKEKRDILVKIAPDEHHTLALAPFISRVGVKFLQVRAACRLLWRYGILMEIVEGLSTAYKAKEQVSESRLLRAHLEQWSKQGYSFFDKLRSAFKRLLTPELPQDEVIGHFSDVLEISKIEKEVRALLIDLGYRSYVLVDRLDEGFDPTKSSVAFIDGAVSAAIDVAAAFKGLVRPVVFLRDNIYRAVAYYDQDYARNIEGQTLRLHWDVNNLFYLVCNRIRAAFGENQENNKRLWSRFAAHDLQGEDGFKRCLTFTLYRPRDILILLNSAFENSSKRDMSVAVTTIAMQDIEKSAKIISVNRLDDLKKEYNQIFPSIGSAVACFEGGAPELIMFSACEKLGQIIADPPDENQTQLELAILERPEELVRALYSVGFLGTYDAASSSFVFSHDGKRPETEFEAKQRLLVHPCYWMALDLTSNSLDPEQAAEINDEYEIKVASATPQIRISRLNKLMSEYTSILTGAEGARDFEAWCLDAIKICFAGKLDNIELHGNKNSTNRRDILGTNLGKPLLWQRIQQDYGTRQVIFEIKNYEELTQEDYRQMLSYLSGRYGRLGFFVTRGHGIGLERNKELDWFKSMNTDHNVVIIKLTARFLSDILGKLRNPKKHYAADQAVSSLLDTYERLYLGQQTTRSKRRAVRQAIKAGHS
jgi:hypothetical protein